MINIHAHPHALIQAAVSDIYGGKAINIMLTPEAVDAINWISQYRAQLERERLARQNNPVLQELYDSYQTALNLSQP